MPSPFTGMDPYLEQTVCWSSFHTRLIVAIADAIAPSLRPKYYVEVEARTYLDESDEDVLVGRSRYRVGRRITCILQSLRSD